MVEREKQRFRVAGKDEIKQHNGRDYANQQHGKREVVIKLQVAIDRDSEEASEAVVDSPDGEQKVAGLSLVGVAAAGTSIEGSKIIAQGADAQVLTTLCLM